MQNDEKNRFTDASSWYLEDQLNFDKNLIQFRYQSLKPYIKKGTALELGSAEGEMTKYLLNDFHHLTIVDGAKKLLNLIPDTHNLTKILSLFENYEPDCKFDTIIAEHILEHVDEPVELLKRVKNWLNPNGRLLIGVPNGNSIHRLVAVKMGLLENPCELNERDLTLGHRRVYTKASLTGHLNDAGLVTNHIGGVFFKPLSNAQIESTWTKDMIQGFFELGKDFPEHAAELFAVCEKDD